MLDAELIAHRAKLVAKLTWLGEVLIKAPSWFAMIVAYSRCYGSQRTTSSGAVSVRTKVHLLLEKPLRKLQPQRNNAPVELIQLSPTIPA